MRRVSSHNDPVWRRGGIGSSDIAAILNMGYSDRDVPIVKFAEKRAMLDRQELKEMRKVVGLNQDTPEWHQFRSEGVGGSEIAGVLGKSKYANPMKVWKNKVGLSSGEPENAAMRHGKQYEPEARKLYEAVFSTRMVPVCCMHDEHDCVRVSLDGLREPGDDVLCEIKAPKNPNNHRMSLLLETIEDPVQRSLAFEESMPHYRCQVHFQLAVTGCKVAHFLSYSPDFPAEQRLAVVEIYPDLDYQQYMVDRCVYFWTEFVEKRVPPPLGW